MSTSSGLLGGVRVLDLSRVLAGPFCTMLLGDLGADVIKVEAPGRGDDTRHWGPPFTSGGESAYFLSANRNKRGITLNLKSEPGLEVLKDLVAKSDVLIENFKVGTLERMGLGYETLQSLQPGLVYCTITGYGYTGPWSQRPGYDYMAQALGGLMAVTGPADGEPYKVGVAISDIITGILAANAILAALYARKETGAGQRIDMALLDSVVATMTYMASNYLVSGEEPKRYGNAHPNIVPYQTFQTKDRYIAVGIGNDGQWAKFCQAVGRPEWQADERFATNPARVEHRAVLLPMLDELFASKGAAEWLQLCEQLGLPAAPINSISEVFENEQVKARERVVQVQHSNSGQIPLLASPFTIPTAPAELRYPPPLLGEHNEEILTEVLGYSQEKIGALQADGLV